MDLALTIFNVGAGLGVLVAGLATAYLAWRTTPLIRESRATVAELRRLVATADAELRPLVTRAQEVIHDVEVLSEDAAVKLDRLADLQAQRSAFDQPAPTPAPRRAEGWPVESTETREGWG